MPSKLLTKTNSYLYCGTTGYIGVAGGKGDTSGNSQSAVSLQVGVTIGEQKCVDQKAIEQARGTVEVEKTKILADQAFRTRCVEAMVSASPQAIDKILGFCNK